jgi:hypothetical protein
MMDRTLIAKPPSNSPRRFPAPPMVESRGYHGPDIRL